MSLPPHGRFQPVLREYRRIGRPRLVLRVASRFDDRLTLVRAPAGHGKTSLITEAMANNAMDPNGEDVLVSVTDIDADPIQLLAIIAQALGAEFGPEFDIDEAIARICDLVWSRAPEDVAVILDDAHRLMRDECARVLDRLLESMPANGHLVLVGRDLPPVASSRLALTGTVNTIDGDDLLLDDDEVDRLMDSRSAGPELRSQLPRLAALADLMLTAGAETSQQYLWEEVLDDIDSERLAGLTAVSVPGSVDDEVVRHLTDGRWDGVTLLSDLPMVDINSDGVWQLHGLLRSALRERADPEQLRKIAVKAAEHAQQNGDLISALELWIQAENKDQALDILSWFAQQPQMSLTRGHYVKVVETAGRLVPGSLIHEILEAQSVYHGFSFEQIERFTELARQAKRVGAKRLEAVAIMRVSQGLEHHDGHPPADLVERIGILAIDDPFARAVDAHLGANALVSRGDVDGVRFLLRFFDGFSPQTQEILGDGRRIAIGWPDEVAPGAEVEDVYQMETEEFYQALAIWLRGEVAPEVALGIVADMARLTERRAPRHSAVANYAAGVMVALAADEKGTAGRWLRRASEQVRPAMPPNFRCFEAVSAALYAGYCGDDEPLRTVDVIMPSGQWVWLAAFAAVPALYSRQPRLRHIFDSAEFGPSTLVAVDIGRALVELYERQSSAGAESLPWDRPTFLRCHTLPGDLAALAAAAAESGDEKAAACCETIPESRRWLTAVANGPDRPGKKWASEKLDAFPSSSPAKVAVLALGPITVDGLDTERWKRARVRELLACLIEYRSTDRMTLAMTLWPDFEPDKALSNLRVNLVHLNKALAGEQSEFVPGQRVESAEGVDQVDRGEERQVVISEGSNIRLADWVQIDVDQFDELFREAQQLDSDGVPAEALKLYVQALSLVRGSYLEGVDHIWADPSRSRLQAAVLASRCRTGELLLAKGEPERAIAWGVEATRSNPLDERAARLVMSCLAATGDRIGAVEMGERLCQELNRLEFEPEPLTIKAIDRLRGRSRSA